MRRTLTLSVLLATLLVVLSLARAWAQQLPEPVGYVNDFANLIEDSTQAQMEESLRQFEEETTVEVAVVTVPDLQGTTIEDFAVRLFERWGIGKKDVDNGVLLLLAEEERDVRIEVGYGMEPYITDGDAGRILDRDVVPHLRQGDYTTGLRNGANAIMQTIRDSDYQPGSVRPRPEPGPNLQPYRDRLWILWPVGFLTLYIVSYMARSRSIWLGGLWGAAAGSALGWVGGSLLFILVGAAGLGILGLILDALLSSAYRYQKATGHSTAWYRSWGGFYGAGSNRGGGSRGFGGFGVGRSGGGGASRGF